MRTCKMFVVSKHTCMYHIVDNTRTVLNIYGIDYSLGYEQSWVDEGDLSHYGLGANISIPPCQIGGQLVFEVQLAV